MEIKKLNTKHFWLLVSMIRKGGKDAIFQLQALEVKEKIAKEEAAKAAAGDAPALTEEEIKKQKADADMERGMILFDIAMEHAETDLQKLFADLADMTLDEYQQADFDLTLEIIEQLADKEDLASFFQRAANFAKKFLPKKQTA